MEDKSKVRKYKNDEFKINCIYSKDGKTLNKIIEEAFKSYYELKVNT
jgi:hypothetical protein